MSLRHWVETSSVCVLGILALSCSPLANAPMGYVLVRPGSFMMGSNLPGENKHVYDIRHKVTLTRAFYMCTHETTRAELASVMGASGVATNIDGLADNLPMVDVSWYNAVLYCNKLSERDGLTPAYRIDMRGFVVDEEGMVVFPEPDIGDEVTRFAVWEETAAGYRLPTEAEWEYACRAGAKTCGPDSKNLASAWLEENSGRRLHAVGMKRANSWGLYDMVGNASEWVWDLYPEEYYMLTRREDLIAREAPAVDPSGASKGSDRIYRGGDFASSWTFCHCARLDGSSPRSGWSDRGFRVVRWAE